MFNKVGLYDTYHENIGRKGETSPEVLKIEHISCGKIEIGRLDRVDPFDGKYARPKGTDFKCWIFELASRMQLPNRVRQVERTRYITIVTVILDEYVRLETYQITIGGYEKKLIALEYDPIRRVNVQIVASKRAHYA